LGAKKTKGSNVFLCKKIAWWVKDMTRLGLGNRHITPWLWLHVSNTQSHKEAHKGESKSYHLDPQTFVNIKKLINNNNKQSKYEGGISTVLLNLISLLESIQVMSQLVHQLWPLCCQETKWSWRVCHDLLCIAQNPRFVGFEPSNLGSISLAHHHAYLSLYICKKIFSFEEEA
jgi:hypothetical protein